jgi:hypothetical protein
MKFDEIKVGEKVRWLSHSRWGSKIKEGVVVYASEVAAPLPQEMQDAPISAFGYQAGASRRPCSSVIVKVGDRYYGPRINQLELVKPAKGKKG